jgi:hypothetical protein
MQTSVHYHHTKGRQVPDDFGGNTRKRDHFGCKDIIKTDVNLYVFHLV